MFENPSLAEIRYVCRNLREQSLEEINGAGVYDADDYAEWIHGCSGFQWVGYHDNKPAAILGAIPQGKDRWMAFGFGTDGWSGIWRAVTRTARYDLVKKLEGAGYKELKSCSPSQHKDVHRWLEFLGMEKTGDAFIDEQGEEYDIFTRVRK